jgi:tRNA(His) 5'-end guanylyltransferase
MNREINQDFLPYFNSSLIILPNEDLFKRYFKIRQLECKTQIFNENT